jgi:hypothetical protein
MPFTDPFRRLPGSRAVAQHANNREFHAHTEDAES